jgi:ABC-type uncharacterized transport system permease subunit|tara:strand:+ start:708 stop:1007 length:300 start_codon:yes stop_codon:yes gene_type:complete
MSVRSICESGFHTYLAEQHQKSSTTALSMGLLVGGVGSAIFAFANTKLKLGANQLLAIVPLTVITAFSVLHGTMSVNSEDLEHKEAFDSICSKYAEDGE